MGLRKKVNEYVKNKLKDNEPEYVRAPKVIHDTILGTNLFKKHEIALLDLPILQRLRRINQVDVVSLVFPSGNHNRFEHTLGVAVIAEKLVSALYRKINDGVIDFQGLNKFNKKYVLRHTRIAAILHDCGHGPFSHMSEQIFENYTDLNNLENNNRKFDGASPHEILSYLIVTSDFFKDYFKNNIQKKYSIGEVDLDLVGEMIIGYVSDPKKAFMVDIINGAFDADKLDYIQRDSHFTGIKMVLDLDRLFHTLNIVKVNNKLRLSIDLSGVSTLEQIVFNKMMLFSTVYHHHKVLAAECVFKSIFDEIKNNNQKICNKNFNSTADFLYITDDDIFSLKKENKNLVSKFANDLCNRNLPKRAFVISNKTIEQDIDSKEGLRNIMGLKQNSDQMKDVKKVIAEKATDIGNVTITSKDFWIDIPGEPSFKEGMQWPVKTYDKNDGYKKLRDIFPVDDWVKAFSENKWQGYVFTWPEYRKSVYKACKFILEKLYDIKFNELSLNLCKFDYDRE